MSLVNEAISCAIDRYPRLFSEARGHRKSLIARRALWSMVNGDPNSNGMLARRALVTEREAWLARELATRSGLTIEQLLAELVAGEEQIEEPAAPPPRAEPAQPSSEAAAEASTHAHQLLDEHVGAVSIEDQARILSAFHRSDGAAPRKYGPPTVDVDADDELTPPDHSSIGAVPVEEDGESSLESGELDEDEAQEFAARQARLRDEAIARARAEKQQRLLESANARRDLARRERLARLQRLPTSFARAAQQRALARERADAAAKRARDEKEAAQRAQLLEIEREEQRRMRAAEDQRMAEQARARQEEAQRNNEKALPPSASQSTPTPSPVHSESTPLPSQSSTPVPSQSATPVPSRSSTPVPDFEIDGTNDAFAITADTKRDDSVDVDQLDVANPAMVESEDEEIMMGSSLELMGSLTNSSQTLNLTRSQSIKPELGESEDEEILMGSSLELMNSSAFVTENAEGGGKETPLIVSNVSVGDQSASPESSVAAVHPTIGGESAVAEGTVHNEADSQRDDSNGAEGNNLSEALNNDNLGDEDESADDAVNNENGENDSAATGNSSLSICFYSHCLCMGKL